MERISLAQDLGQRLAAIKSKMQTLAPAALQQDRAALKQLESLEQEQNAIRRRAELEELAATESKRLAAEQEAEAAKQARAKRLADAWQEQQIIVESAAQIDEMLHKLEEACQRRLAAIRRLFALRVTSSNALNRMQSKFPLTAALHAANINALASVEPVLPGHRKTMTEQTSWLAKPLDEHTTPEKENSDE